MPGHIENCSGYALWHSPTEYRPVLSERRGGWLLLFVPLEPILFLKLDRESIVEDGPSVRRSLGSNVPRRPFHKGPHRSSPLTFPTPGPDRFQALAESRGLPWRQFLFFLDRSRSILPLDRWPVSIE